MSCSHQNNRIACHVHDPRQHRQTTIAEHVPKFAPAPRRVDADPVAALARVQLLILDDWAITPLTAEQRRDLMEIVDNRHDRASTIVTSQVPVKLWHEHIGNLTIVDAVRDRLVHGAHRLELKG